MSDASVTPNFGLILLSRIVVQPLATFRAILEHSPRRWVLPFLLCITGLFVVTVVMAPHIAEQVQQKQQVLGQLDQAKMGVLTESQKEKLNQLAATSTDPLVLGGFTMFIGIIGLLMSWVLGSAALYFGLNLGGQEVRYAALFSAFSWSWLPFFLSDLVRAVWQFFTGQMIANPGLSYLVATGDEMVDSGNPLWILASIADLFVIWHFVLIYFLIRALRSRKTGLALTSVYIVSYVALALVSGMLLSSR